MKALFLIPKIFITLYVIALFVGFILLFDDYMNMTSPSGDDWERLRPHCQYMGKLTNKGYAQVWNCDGYYYLKDNHGR